MEIWAPTQTPAAGPRACRRRSASSECDITIHLLRAGGGFGRRLTNDYMVEARGDREADRRAAGQAAVDARRRHAPRPLSPRRLALPEGRRRRDRQDRGVARSLRDLRRGRHSSRHSARCRQREFPARFVPNFAMHGVADAAGRADVGAARAAQQRVLVGVPVVHRRARARGGKDPVQFRVDLLAVAAASRRRQQGADGFDAKRALGVLRKWPKRAGWDKRALAAEGPGMGVAWQHSHRGYFAEVADVTVDAMNRVKVNKVWVVGDIGSQIVNPSMAINQAQGAVIDGMSQLMYVRDHDRRRPGGAGQLRHSSSRSACAGAAGRSTCTSWSRTIRRPDSASRRCRRCCRRWRNAIFAASGKRVRTLPISKSGFRLA